MSSGISLSDLRAMLPDARGGRRVAETPVVVRAVRMLGEEDLPALMTPPKVGYTQPVLKRLRTQHHHLARLMGVGKSEMEAALACGYSISTITRLKADPAFQELMVYYKTQGDAQYVDVHAQLAGLGTLAVEELRERLEESPEKFEVKELLAVGEFALDRSVAPPKNRQSTGATALPQISISFHGGSEAAPLLTQVIEGEGTPLPSAEGGAATSPTERLSRN